MGVILLLVGLAVLGFGLAQHFKGKRILAAPFKKTGDIARDPTSSDPKGLMSTEGSVQAPAQTLLSPCTKTACLYYEVKIDRLWEKTEQTQDGAKTTKGTTNVETIRGGAIFGLDDGTGVIMVDASKGGDFDNMKKGYDKELGRGFFSNTIQFGELAYGAPPLPSGEHTTGFRAVEQFVPMGGTLFALGKIENGKLSKPGWRSMMFSTKGRDGLLSSTAKKKKFSFIGGGVAAVAAIPLMIFGPKSEPRPDTSCQHLIAGVQSKCDANVTSAAGDDYTWNVEKEGAYELKVTPPAGKKYPLDAQIVLKNATGEVIEDHVADSIGSAVSFNTTVKPGVYTVTVRDATGDKVKGGFDYAMEIASISADTEIAPSDDGIAKGDVIDPLNAPEAQPAAKAVAAAATGKKPAKLSPAKGGKKIK